MFAEHPNVSSYNESYTEPARGKRSGNFGEIRSRPFAEIMLTLPESLAYLRESRSYRAKYAHAESQGGK